MLWETCVPQTTLGVAFGARLRSIPLGLLDRPLGHLDAKAAQGRPRTPERIRPGTLWATNVAQGCLPDLVSECLRLHPNFPWGGYILRRRERHAHEVS